MIAFIRNHKAGVAAASLIATAGLAWLAFGFFGIHTLFIDEVVDEDGPVFDAAPAAVVDAAEDAAAPAAASALDESAPPATAAPAAAPATEDGAARPDTADPADTADGEAPPADAPTSEPEVAPSTTVAPEPRIVTEFQGTFVSEDHPTSGTAVVLGNGTGQRFLRFEDFATDNGPDLNVYLFDDETGEFVDLGDLKGNIGDQNYEIPADVDLDRFDRVSIWCVRFGVGFGSAELMTP